MKPEKDDIKNRIINHLRWRGPTDSVALLWHGYLAALLEWGLLEAYEYDELKKLLPPARYKEMVEVFLDEPIRPDMEKELDEYHRDFKYKLPKDARK